MTEFLKKKERKENDENYSEFEFSDNSLNLETKCKINKLLL